MTRRTRVSLDAGWIFMILPGYHSGQPLGFTHTLSRRCPGQVVSVYAATIMTVVILTSNL